MKLWSEIGFEIEITGDSSPSLRLLQSIDPTKYRGESMHHSGGACAETLLIYGKPAHEILKTIQKPHFLVVGLGMGYIEMTIAREALLLGFSSQDVGLITSYESVPELRDYFVQWLWDRTENLAEEVWQTYEQACAAVIQHTDLKVSQIKIFLRSHFPTTSAVLGALSADVMLPSKYHCILYDAFSSKTSPFLWEEEFLTKLFQQAAAPFCQVSTYACKVSLKQALQNNGFEVTVREGFKGKRNSTLGVRKP